MPASVPLAAFIFGGVLVLIAVLGGSFNIFGIEVSGTVRGPLRVAAGAVGLPLLAVGIYLTFSEQDAPASNAPPRKNAKVSGLEVSYQASEYGADVSIGNTSDDIIIVTEPTFHWTYQECPKLTAPKAGALMQKYRYTVKLSKEDGSKLLDSRAFKYSNGEADNFVIDLHFPGHSVYTMWLSLRYKYLGNSTERPYETKQQQVRLCYRY